MQIRFRFLTALALLLVTACAENDLDVGVVDAAADSPVSTAGTGGPSTGGGGGTGGVGTGGAGGAASGPCGEATCLTALFQTCVPAGSCAVHAGNSPSAVFSETCYANGVTVSDVSTGSETSTTRTLAVTRNGVLCYSITSSAPIAVSGLSYVITDGNGREVATGATADKAGAITVTCSGSAPTTVSGSCLHPVNSNPTCDLQACPSTDGYDGGIGTDATEVDGGSPVCDPFAPAPKPIALGTVLGVGRSADGTIYVADQAGSTYRVFVSDATGTLARQSGGAGSIISDASGTEYVFVVSDTVSPFVLEVDVAKSGAVRMGVLQGTMTDRKQFVIGQDGEELTVLASSAIANLPLRNLPGSVTVEYVATLPDGQLMLVTRPTDDWTYADFRVFLGPPDRVAERVVASVTRYLDGGTTDIVFDLDGVQATAHFPVVLADGGFSPGPASLTVPGAVTPLTRLSAPPSATYLCL